MNGLTICLTGGIASGKTFVSDYFASKGTPVVDADVIAREVVAKGKPALTELSKRFGRGILQANGTLNRAGLKHVAFSSPENTADLNGILHPVIGSEIKAQLSLIDQPIKLLVIPLFKESMKSLYDVNRVLLVDVAEDIQLNRVMQRDAVDSELAEKIIASQASRTRRVSVADDVLVNNGTFEYLNQQLAVLNDFYQSLIKEHFDN